MDTLEVSVSRVVTSLNQSLETSLHQSAYAAAQNCLLTEQVCLSLGSECGLQDTCSCSADSQAVCQCILQSLASRILLYRYQTGSSLAGLVLASYGVARSLGSDHGNVYVLRLVRSDPKWMLKP